jgi:hypothetical protein
MKRLFNVMVLIGFVGSMTIGGWNEASAHAPDVSDVGQITAVNQPDDDLASVIKARNVEEQARAREWQQQVVAAAEEPNTAVDRFKNRRKVVVDNEVLSFFPSRDDASTIAAQQYDANVSLQLAPFGPAVPVSQTTERALSLRRT